MKVAEHAVSRRGRMRIGPVRTAAVCAAMVAAFPIAPALAQEGGVGSGFLQDRRGETVLRRARPDFDPQGVRVGAFTVRAGLAEDFGYNDNVTSAHSSPKSSATLVSRGTASVTPTWQRHALLLDADVQDYRYFSVSSQDYTNWGAGVSGRYEIERAWRVFGGYRHNVIHELQDDPNAEGADVPIKYTRDMFRLGTRYGFNRVYVQPFGALMSYRYDDAEFSRQPVSQAYRDRDVWFGRFEVGYEFSPLRTAFVATNIYRANYVNTPAPGVPKFDNVTYELVAGIDYDSDGIWNYRVSAGVRRRDYDSAERSSVTGLALDALAVWRATPMTTVTGTASTSIEEGSTTSEGYRDNIAMLQVDHEYLRNVLLQARGRVRHIDYLEQDRDSVTLTGGIGVNYLVNRTLRLGASYEYTQRFSDRTGDQFDRNIVLLRLSLGL